jgi:circadian clock protein KaiB
MNPKESLPKLARGVDAPSAATQATPKTLQGKEPRVEPDYLLRLFVSGFTPRSQRAIDNLQNICERYLAGRHRIEVVDLYQSPGAARDAQIVATPTLVKILPLPAGRVIGDLSQVDKVLRGLEKKSLARLRRQARRSAIPK